MSDSHSVETYSLPEYRYFLVTELPCFRDLPLYERTYIFTVKYYLQFKQFENHYCYTGTICIQSNRRENLPTNYPIRNFDKLEIQNSILEELKTVHTLHYETYFNPLYMKIKSFSTFKAVGTIHKQ